MSRDELVWFKLFPKDILSDYRLEALGPLGGFAFFLLTCRACIENPVGTLPGDDESLQRMSRLTVEEWATVREKLLVIFALRDDGRRICPMVQEQLAGMDELSEKRRAAGSKGGRPRRQDRGEHLSQVVDEPDRDNVTDVVIDDCGNGTPQPQPADQGLKVLNQLVSKENQLVSFAKKNKANQISESEYDNDHDAQMGWSSDSVRSACLGVTVEELKSPGALESRWKRLADAGAVTRTEDGFARVIALACRCLRLGRANPPGLFVSMIRESKWDDLAQQDIDEAHRKIRTWRYGPQQRRANRSCHEEAPDSGPAPLGKAIRAVCGSSLKG